MVNKILMWIGIIIIVGLGFFFVKGSLIGDAVGVSGEVIEIPFSEISETAKFFEYNGIRYFAVQAKDGSIKTAFDACDVCYSSKKGYRQEEDYMICNNCGNRYPISGLGTENLRGGGCWPGYLPSFIKDENLVIKINDLEKGKYRFE